MKKYWVYLLFLGSLAACASGTDFLKDQQVKDEFLKDKCRYFLNNQRFYDLTPLVFNNVDKMSYFTFIDEVTKATVYLSFCNNLPPAIL